MGTTTLRRSNDRKVAADVTPAGGVRIANAFGLPSGNAYSCPGATTVCSAICYAGKIENVRKAVLAMMLSNWNALQGKDEDGMYALISEMISDFVAECDRKGGTKSFRIHWDGDFFSLDYARAWARVIRENSDVTFWAYTRSFVGDVNVIPILAGIPNLSLYLSVDKVNLSDAKRIRKAFPSVRWAFLGQDSASTKADMLAAGNDRPGAICPENVKRIPLITDKGGACITCSLCVEGKADVRFAIAKR